MTGYRVVVKADAGDLEFEVQALMNDGWTPFGGVAISGWFEAVENSRKDYTETDTQTMFAQAMVRP